MTGLYNFRITVIIRLLASIGPQAISRQSRLGDSRGHETDKTSKSLKILLDQMPI